MAEKKSPAVKKTAAARMMSQQVPPAPKPTKKPTGKLDKEPRRGPRGGR